MKHIFVQLFTDTVSDSWRTELAKSMLHLIIIYCSAFGFVGRELLTGYPKSWALRSVSTLWVLYKTAPLASMS